MKNSIYLSKEDIKRYNNIESLTAEYPASFLLGSEYRHDMNEMHNALEKVGAENILVDPFAEYGEVKPHCFVANERVDPIAKEAFDKLMAFINEKTK